MKQHLPFAFRNRNSIKIYYPTGESILYNEVTSEPCMPSIKGSMLRELFQNQLGMLGESNCTVCLSERQSSGFRILLLTIMPSLSIAVYKERIIPKYNEPSQSYSKVHNLIWVSKISPLLCLITQKKYGSLFSINELLFQQISAVNNMFSRLSKT